MKEYTAHQIWKKIHFTNPQDLDDFDSETKFVKLDDAMNELKEISERHS